MAKTKRKSSARKAKRTSKSRTKSRSAKKRKSSASKSAAARKVNPASVKAYLKRIGNKPLTRAQQIKVISTVTGMRKQDVAAVVDCQRELIDGHLNGGPGQISHGGLMKIVVIRKPATKARKGINPFTGEPTVFKAKPARKVVKIRPLKALKDMVA